MKRVGIDLGYGFVKVSNGESEFTFPSVVGSAQELHYHGALGNHSSPIENLVTEMKGDRYFIGDLAIRKSGMAIRSLDPDRVNDTHARVLFMTGLGLLASWENDAFHVVTGLPTSAYGPDHARYSQSLTGHHEILFGHNGELTEKRISVEKVHVIPQPFGTIYDQALDDQGKLQGSDWDDLRVGVVDIGFKTSDFAVADSLDFIDHLSRSTPTALATAYGMIAEDLRQRYGVQKENHQLDKIVRSGRVRVAGQVHDISDIREQAFRRVATKIVTEIGSLWDYRDLDMILVTGGGGRALADYIVAEYPNARLVDDPQVANARGYAKLSRHMQQFAQAASEEQI